MPETRIPYVDFHTAGEPFRIVVADGAHGVPELDGTTVADRRATALADQAADGPIDRARRLLCHEPRGHRDMYGGFITPPDPVESGAPAAFGVVFWHKDGYSTACGHGTIALGVWAVEEGIVEAPRDGVVEVPIDVPSGRVAARVTMAEGRVASVGFVNVPSSVRQLDVEVQTSVGVLRADLSYGGGTYAQVRAADAGLAVEPRCYDELVRLGREIKWALNEHPAAKHPSDPRLDGVYATMWLDELGSTDEGPHQRNLVIFADGQADRSPCGSGTAARCATLRARGILGGRQTLRHESIVGTTFTAVADDGPGEGEVLAVVTGGAHRIAEGTAIVRPDDDLQTGFLLQ